MEHLVRHRMDLDDVLYTSPFGPITALDVIFGYGRQIEESGSDFWAHKTGFTLHRCIAETGFKVAYLSQDENHVELRPLSFKSKPTAAQANMLVLDTIS